MRDKIAHDASSHSECSFFVGSSEGYLGRIAVVVATGEPFKSLGSAEYILEVESMRAHVSGPTKHRCYQMKLRRKAQAGSGEAS